MSTSHHCRFHDISGYSILYQANKQRKHISRQVIKSKHIDRVHTKKWLLHKPCHVERRTNGQQCHKEGEFPLEGGQKPIAQGAETPAESLVHKVFSLFNLLKRCGLTKKGPCKCIKKVDESTHPRSKALAGA